MPWTKVSVIPNFKHGRFEAKTSEKAIIRCVRFDVFEMHDDQEWDSIIPLAFFRPQSSWASTFFSIQRQLDQGLFSFWNTTTCTPSQLSLFEENNGANAFSECDSKARYAYDVQNINGACQCDALCDKFGDCCQNTSVLSLGRITHKHAFSLALENRVDCVSTEFGLNEFVGIGFYLISSCAPEYSGHELESKCLSTMKHLQQSIIYYVPVDTRKRRASPFYAYRNIFCALCNGESMTDIEFWRVTFFVPNVLCNPFTKVSNDYSFEDWRRFCRGYIHGIAWPGLPSYSDLSYNLQFGGERMGRLCFFEDRRNDFRNKEKDVSDKERGKGGEKEWQKSVKTDFSEEDERHRTRKDPPPKRRPSRGRQSSPLTRKEKRMDPKQPSNVLKLSQFGLESFLDLNCWCQKCEENMDSFLTTNTAEILFVLAGGDDRRGLFSMQFYEDPLKYYRMYMPNAKRNYMEIAPLAGFSMTSGILLSILVQVFCQKNRLAAGRQRDQVGIFLSKLMLHISLIGAVCSSDVERACQVSAICIHYAMNICYLHSVWFILRTSHFFWRLKQRVVNWEQGKGKEAWTWAEGAAWIAIWLGNALYVGALSYYDRFVSHALTGYGQKGSCFLTSRWGLLYLLMVPAIIKIGINLVATLYCGCRCWWGTRFMGETQKKIAVYTFSLWLRTAAFETSALIFGLIYFFKQYASVAFFFQVFISLEGVYIWICKFMTRSYF